MDIKGKLSLNGGKIRTDADGEIFARSLHTVKGSYNVNRGYDSPAQDWIVTSAIDSLGNATFESVFGQALEAAFQVTSGSAGFIVNREDHGTNTLDFSGITFRDDGGEVKGMWSSTSGDFLTQGNQTVLGVKNAVVSTKTAGRRKLYCDESTEIYFFDRRQGKLANGRATVTLDELYLQIVTIDDDHPMLVQITLTGDCNGVYISEKTAASFTVRELMNGTSNASFDWEVAAKRKGYEDNRLESFTIERE